MKFTLSWLQEHLETTASLEEIAERLTGLGLEVEGMHDPASALKDFVVGHVTKAEQHPDADRLKVCMVDNGSETFQVICGAPNAREGMKGVFAASGQYVPGIDMTLKKAKIRGVESNGMLLSEKEMGLSEDHQGIVELPKDAPVGKPVVEVMGLNDPIIEIAITPNRGDCLGVRGIARDLAAAGLGELKPLKPESVSTTWESPVKVNLEFGEKTRDACPYFIGRTIKGVKNGPSPKWLQDRLTAIGLRPISALVDITNYVMMEHNRPLHVFDADKVKGDLTVRLAKDGETLAALDERTYTLDGEMTVIADENGPEALGGVIGGEDSGCTEETTNVFLEVAYFDPVRTAATGRKLNIMTDARYRFERGVDPAFMLDAAEIATRMILDLCGGEASELVIAGEEPDVSRTYRLHYDRIRSLGGVEMEQKAVDRILDILGCDLKSDGEDAVQVTVPTWRHDIEGEADLIEEVIRIYGYDKVPAVSVPTNSALPQPALLPEQRRAATARRALAARGFREAVTYSFLSHGHAGLFGGVEESLRLANPISADLDVMRPSILPNLISAAGQNADRGYPDACLFEVGPAYQGDAPEDQQALAGAVRTGDAVSRSWHAGARPVDVFDAKADALAVLEAVGAPVTSAQITADAPGWYHPGRSGVIRLGPNNVLACFGEVHPGVLKAMDVDGPVAAVEVFLSNLPKAKQKDATRPPLHLSAFQPVERDFAFVVDENVPAADLIAAARGADKTLIADVRLFDHYAGEKIEKGKKSLAVAVTLQPTDKTLTDAEIDAVSDKVVESVKKATGGALRE